MNLIGITILGAILTLLRMVSGFLVSKFVAVYAGPSGLAMLGQLQSFIAGINGLVTNQISQGVVRYTAENKHNYAECKPFWRASVTVLYISLGIFIPLLCVFSQEISIWLFGNDTQYWLIIIAVFALPLNAVNSILLATLNGLGENRINITSSMISVIISLLFTLLSLYIFGVNGGLVALALNNAISAIIVIYRVYKSPWFSVDFWFGFTDKDKIRSMQKYLAMGIIGALTGPTAMVLVRNIIMDNTSLIDAGLWQSVMRVSDAYIAMITIGVGMYYFPKVAAITKRKELLSVTIKVLIFVASLVTIGALIIFNLRDFIIHILFTEEFINARDLFKPQLLADFFKVMSFIPASILLAKGYFKLNIIAEILTNSLLVLSTSYLVTLYGVIGANYAYLFTYVCYCLFSFSFFLFHFKKLS